VPEKEGHVFLINTAKYSPDGSAAATDEQPAEATA